MADLAGLPIPVSTGFTWTSAGACGTFFAVLGLAIRQWVPWRKVKLEADRLLIQTLSERVMVLERKMDEKDAKHDAEVSLLRHQINGSESCLDVLLALLEDVEDLPERARTAIKKTKAMRREQRDRETIEKATMRGAAMAGRAPILGTPDIQ